MYWISCSQAGCPKDAWISTPKIPEQAKPFLDILRTEVYIFGSSQVREDCLSHNPRIRILAQCSVNSACKTFVKGHESHTTSKHCLYSRLGQCVKLCIYTCKREWKGDSWYFKIWIGLFCLDCWKVWNSVKKRWQVWSGIPLYKYLVCILSWVKSHCSLLLMLMLSHLQVGLFQWDLYETALENIWKMQLV